MNALDLAFIMFGTANTVNQSHDAMLSLSLSLTSSPPFPLPDDHLAKQFLPSEGKTELKSLTMFLPTASDSSSPKHFLKKLKKKL
jgi:hypothetical protein